MCGIFGIAVKKESELACGTLEKPVSRLFKLSESRGREASGLALFCNGKITVYKRPEPASLLICGREYGQLFSGPVKAALIGHARLVTNGALEDNRNNQPVVKEGIVAVHNGIIVNDAEIWEAFPSLKKEYEVDTEALLALVRMFLNQGKSLVEAVISGFSIIRGSASLALLFEGRQMMVLATDTGSLYTWLNPHKGVLIFASERYILESFFKKRRFKKLLSGGEITQLKPYSGLLIDTATLAVERFVLPTSTSPIAERKVVPKPPEVVRAFVPKHLLVDVSDKVDALRRCSKCILPETMPFIEFDEQGVCNYCKNYQKVEAEGREALEKAIAPCRSNSRRPDVLVPFSGGRDSSFTLHYLKKVMGLTPIAYSYDWGMLTDLGRRNQARMCGSLGVEHILVSADIKKKRENIRKNVLAWLKRPDLGTVPLFMAGDKQYFYYANKLMKQTGMKLIILGFNPYEKTDFKYGFSGVRQRDLLQKQKTRFALISGGDKLKLAAYYLKQFLANPAYLNSSLTDSLTAYLAYYFIPHNYLSFYRYKRWDEEEIISTLTGQYNWEVAEDTKDTWRIGDGTAAIYNYIYYLIAGFTENDTFRSNQIREGMLTRQEALNLARQSNQPRYESIKWYCNTIGIDFERTLRIINSIPRLY